METVINNTQISKDFDKKSIVVSREFNAPVEEVWQAYTDPKILDQWWGPAPWRAETKHMDFRVGGYWLCVMIGPQGEKQWGRMNYLAIDRHKSFEAEDEFCDENGKLNAELPVSKTQMVFTKTKTGTKADFIMTYSTEADLEKIVDMGFEQGISICMDQLEKLLEK